MILQFMTRHPWLLITLALGAAVIGCKDFEDCRTDYTLGVYVEFKNMDPSKIDTIVSSRWGSLSINDNKREKGFSLPLDPGSDTTSFFVHRRDPYAVDTLIFFYTTIPFLVSPQCGVHQAYILDSLQTTFARDTIMHPTLKKSNQEPNVQVSY